MLCTLQHKFSLNFYLIWHLHNSNEKNRHSKGLFVTKIATMQVHSTIKQTFRKSSVVKIRHFLWRHHEALGFLSVNKIFCNFGSERSFSFKLAPPWTAAFELANRVLNMGFRRWFVVQPKFTFHILKYSWTRSSLPVDLIFVLNMWVTSCLN